MVKFITSVVKFLFSSSEIYLDKMCVTYIYIGEFSSPVPHYLSFNRGHYCQSLETTQIPDTKYGLDVCIFSLKVLLLFIVFKLYIWYSLWQLGLGGKKWKDEGKEWRENI